jgi:hypothetical protein
MFLEDPFCDSDGRRTRDAPEKWKLAHHDVRHHFEAALYHFGRMLRGNSLSNLKVVCFEYDALVWSLYSIREHFAQELNLFFCLGIEERSVNCGRVKEKLESNAKKQLDIVKMLDELSDAKWFESLKEQRHTITHRVSKPEVIGGSVSLSWGSEPPQVMLNLKSIELYGDKLYREAMRKFKLDWLATSWITIQSFKSQIETIWCAMSRIGDSS